MPNDALAFARKEGSVKLDTQIKLNNVLYIPSLTCNLISIAKLCKELNCSVTFFDNLCAFQDCILGLRLVQVSIEALYHQQPSYDSIKVFGTLCFT